MRGCKLIGWAIKRTVSLHRDGCLEEDRGAVDSRFAQRRGGVYRGVREGPSRCL